MLDEFHALPERFADGLDGLFDRLRGRGVSVVSPAPGHYVIDDGQKKGGLLGKLKASCGC